MCFHQLYSGEHFKGFEEFWHWQSARNNALDRFGNPLQLYQAPQHLNNHDFSNVRFWNVLPQILESRWVERWFFPNLGIYTIFRNLSSVVAWPFPFSFCCMWTPNNVSIHNIHNLQNLGSWSGRTLVPFWRISRKLCYITSFSDVLKVHQFSTSAWILSISKLFSISITSSPQHTISALISLPLLSSC